MDAASGNGWEKAMINAVAECSRARKGREYCAGGKERATLRTSVFPVCRLAKIHIVFKHSYHRLAMCIAYS